ncbi:MAG TPA: tetratricopeptide repeat protein [Methyloceanibacter sp.]
MCPRQSFRLKPIGAFRNGATTGLWFASLLLALLFGFGRDRGLQAAPIQLEPKAGVASPEGAPAEQAPPADGDTGLDDVVGPNDGGTEEVPLGQSGGSPTAPDEELDDNPPLKPDLKPGGGAVGDPQSTEENKQDRLGPKQDNGPGGQSANVPLLAPLDRNKMLGQLYDQLSSAKDLGAARPIMDSIEELWRTSGSDTVDLLLSRVDHFTKDADLDLAGQVLDALTDLAPDNAEVWHKRATVEALSNDYAGALADLRRSLNLDPRNYDAISDLGSVLQQVGEKKEALEAYRKALKANPFLDEARDAVKELTHEVDGQDI